MWQNGGLLIGFIVLKMNLEVLFIFGKLNRNMSAEIIRRISWLANIYFLILWAPVLFNCPLHILVGSYEKGMIETVTSNLLRLVQPLECCFLAVHVFTLHCRVRIWQDWYLETSQRKEGFQREMALAERILEM